MTLGTIVESCRAHERDDDFIREFDNSIPPRGQLTGWENVVFELADEEETAE